MILINAFSLRSVKDKSIEILLAFANKINSSMHVIASLDDIGFCSIGMDISGSCCSGQLFHEIVSQSHQMIIKYLYFIKRFLLKINLNLKG